MMKFEELNLIWLDELSLTKLIKFDKGSWGLVRLFLINKRYSKVFEVSKYYKERKYYSSDLDMYYVFK